MRELPITSSSEQRVSQLENEIEELAECHKREIQELLDQSDLELAKARSRLRTDLSESTRPAPAESRGEQALKVAELSGEIDSLQQQLAWTEERLARSERPLWSRLARTSGRLENRMAPLG